MRGPRLFTVRVMVLAVVTMLAFVLVFPTLRSYLKQRVELEQLNAQVVAARAHNDELNADVARWADNAYVAAQARERLAYVLPGETAYRVSDPQTVPDAPTAAPTAPTSVDGVLPTGSTEPWYTRIWASVLVAGQTGAAGTSGAAATPGDNGTSPADGSSTPAGELPVP